MTEALNGKMLLRDAGLLLDANTYIEAKNLYYGMEVCSGYWQWLDTQFQNNLVNSDQPIFDVLNSYGDELSA